jgi:hypothetical protein
VRREPPGALERTIFEQLVEPEARRYSRSHARDSDADWQSVGRRSHTRRDFHHSSHDHRRDAFA